MPEGDRELSALRLLVHKDARGLAVMSLLCTVDLSPLSKRALAGSEQWHSPLSGAAYDLSGRVISGPAKHPLPYYELFVDKGPPGAPLTLYAYVGRIKDPEWRLTVKP